MMRLHIELEPNPREEYLNTMLTDVYLYLESAIELDEATPRCSWCKDTGHLTECRAIPGSTYLLCRHCLADERRES